MPKEHVAIFALLCIIAFGAGYWHSSSKVDSGERVEVVAPPAPTVVTNVVTGSGLGSGFGQLFEPTPPTVNRGFRTGTTATPPTVNPPALIPGGNPAAPGRSLEWTYGGGPLQRRIDGYVRKPSAIIKKVFGDPDEDQNGVWIYKGMNVIVAKTGQTMTMVRFIISNDQVLSVNAEP